MDSWQAREAELNPKISHQDVLGSEFYCHLLQDNYDLLCKSLILDKSLYAQLLNRCYFTMTMIKHIKTRRVFAKKVQKLLDFLKEKIRVNTDTMKNFCVCLQNIGQGPLSTHFNVIIKRALEKRIRTAKSALKKKPGIFITNPYDDTFRRFKQARYQPVHPVYRPANQVPGGRRLHYRYDLNTWPYGQDQCYPQHEWTDTNKRRETGPPGETTHNSFLHDPLRAYNVLAFLVQRIDTQAKQIEDIKQRLRWVEIDQSVVKKTIGQTITGSGPAIQTHPTYPAYLPTLTMKQRYNEDYE